jgi:methyl-accepting chemotaxis protein
MINDELVKINHQAEVMKSFNDEMVLKVDTIATITEETAASTEEVNALSETQKGASENLHVLSIKLTSTMEALKEAIDKFQL